MDDYIKKPCERCGSKKRVSKTWVETIPTYTGTTDVEYSQIVCTNPECQAEQDKTLLEETQKREVLRKKKEEKDLARKAATLANLSKLEKVHTA